MSPFCHGLRAFLVRVGLEREGRPLGRLSMRRMGRKIYSAILRSLRRPDLPSFSRRK